MRCLCLFTLLVFEVPNSWMPYIKMGLRSDLLVSNCDWRFWVNKSIHVHHMYVHIIIHSHFITMFGNLQSLFIYSYLSILHLLPLYTTEFLLPLNLTSSHQLTFFLVPFLVYPHLKLSSPFPSFPFFFPSFLVPKPSQYWFLHLLP